MNRLKEIKRFNSIIRKLYKVYLFTLEVTFQRALVKYLRINFQVFRRTRRKVVRENFENSRTLLGPFDVNTKIRWIVESNEEEGMEDKASKVVNVKILARFSYFRHSLYDELPNRVRRGTSCCHIAPEYNFLL